MSLPPIDPGLNSMYTAVQNGGILDTSPLDRTTAIITNLNSALPNIPDPNAAGQISSLLGAPLISISFYLSSQFSSFTRNLTVYAAHTELQTALGVSNTNAAIANLPSMFGSVMGGISTQLDGLEAAIANVSANAATIASLVNEIHTITTAEQQVFASAMSDLSNLAQSRSYLDLMNNPLLTPILETVGIGYLANTVANTVAANMAAIGFLPYGSPDDPVSDDPTPYMTDGPPGQNADPTP